MLKSRQGRKIPDGTEFVVVVSVAASGVKGDSVVSRQCQWPVDLREQRIPCVCVQTTHGEVMVHDNCLKVLSRLASQPQARWTSAMVREMEKVLFVEKVGYRKLRDMPQK